MTQHTSLVLKTRPEELQKIESAIDDIASSEGWAPDTEFKIKLLLDELCTNVINYAHDGDLMQNIVIDIASEDTLVTIGVSDSGRPFNPLIDAPEADTGSSLEDREIGGLGIHFVKTLADETRYRREDGKNYLTFLMRRE